MSYPAMFEELPATFPSAHQHKRQSTVGAIAFHIALVTALIVVPLALPQQIEQWRLLAVLSPLPPPPPAAPARGVAPANKPREAARPTPPPTSVRVAPDAIIAPVEIPKVITRYADEGEGSGSGVVGGVEGGVVGGVAGGVLNSMLGGILQPAFRFEAAPPPPPPPKVTPAPAAAPPPSPVKEATQPLRVGGAVDEPRLLASKPPVYPPMARQARIQGNVILEAVLTTAGTVDEIQVVSGHPLLVEAAVDALKQWRYSPTYLNGQAFPVILRVTIEFQLART